MEPNSGKKERIKPINDYFNDQPPPAIPTMECNSEFMRNLKMQQTQQPQPSPPMNYSEHNQTSNYPGMQPSNSPPMPSNYSTAPMQPSAQPGMNEINSAYQQLVGQIPEIANNPGLLKALQVLAMSSQQTPGYSNQFNQFGQQPPPSHYQSQSSYQPYSQMNNQFGQPPMQQFHNESSFSQKSNTGPPMQYPGKFYILNPNGDILIV